jgi:hypothetical protein
MKFDLKMRIYDLFSCRAASSCAASAVFDFSKQSHVSPQATERELFETVLNLLEFINPLIYRWIPRRRSPKVASTEIFVVHHFFLPFQQKVKAEPRFLTRNRSLRS